MRRLGILCSIGLSTMSDPFILSSYDLSTLRESIISYLIGSDHPVLRRVAGPFFKGDTDGRKNVSLVMVFLVARFMPEAEDAEASEA